MKSLYGSFLFVSGRGGSQGGPGPYPQLLPLKGLIIAVSKVWSFSGRVGGVPATSSHLESAWDRIETIHMTQKYTDCNKPKVLLHNHSKMVSKVA